MTRVVLDTNVIVSALHFPQSKLAKILTLAQTKRIDLLISSFILDETEGVLVKKLGWTQNDAQEAKDLIRAMAAGVVDPEETISSFTWRPVLLHLTSYSLPFSYLRHRLWCHSRYLSLLAKHWSN